MPIRIITDSASDFAMGSTPGFPGAHMQATSPGAAPQADAPPASASQAGAFRADTHAASDAPTVIPLTIRFGESEYRDGIDLSHQEFYQKLIENDELPVTSQVNPAQFSQAFEQAIAAGDEVICITLSSKLSGTYQSACIAASEFGDPAGVGHESGSPESVGSENGPVYVVDSLNASIGELVLVQRAMQLASQSDDAAAIVAQLKAERKGIRIVALLDTLEYLYRGGRLSRSAAMAGSLLSIKPVIGLIDGEVEVLGKARGSRNGENLLIKEIEKTDGVDFSKPYAVGYTGLSDKLLQKYLTDSAALWEGQGEKPPIYTIGATIGTHVGPGGIAVAYFKPE